MHHKTFAWIAGFLTLCLVLTGCGFGTGSNRVYMGFDKAEYTVLEEEDTHGGFHGDGSYYLILDCSSNPEKALTIVKEWETLPLSENLELLMYGGARDGVYFAYELAEEAHWPTIEHGYYKFADKQSEDPSDDSGLFGRASFNFEIAVYDTDSNILYFFKFDT